MNKVNLPTFILAKISLFDYFTQIRRNLATIKKEATNQSLDRQLFWMCRSFLSSLIKCNKKFQIGYGGIVFR